MKRATALFLGLQAADMATTLWAFSLGGVEVNWMVARVISLLGPVGALVAVKLFAAGLGLVWVRCGSRRSVYILNVAFGLIVLWNAGQLAKVLL